MEQEHIAIRDPGRGMPGRIPVERIPLGEPGDYKPNVAVMPDGELLLTAFHTNSEKVKPGARPREDILLFRSRDGGATWTPGDDIGDYGMMYPAILRLGGGRVVFTFNVRHVNPPLGVRAVLGTETDAGFVFDFRNNLFVVDDRTPIDRPSGGGFGNTVQAADGTMVTPYSYRSADYELHLEVARWRLP